VHSDQHQAGDPEADASVRAAQARAQLEAKEVIRGGKLRLEVFAPLREGERRFGVLRLVFSLDQVERTLADARRRMAAQSADALRSSVFLTGALAALGVLVAIFFSLRLRGPVRTLVRAATDVAAGQVERRVEVQARDEIGELGHAFNFLANRIQTLLDAAREHAAVENELEVARRIQRMLLPPAELQDFGPLSFAGTVVAASQCSGDFWYWARLHDGSLLIVLGDVEGHGVPAAIFGATARGYLDTLPLLRERADTSAAAVAALLGDLNRAIYGAGRGEVYMTCIALIIDPVRGEVRYANAGNVLPYVYRSPNNFVTLAARGDPLGSAPVLRFEAHTTQLAPGDLIVVYTDGLIEAQAQGKAFGDRRVRQLVQKYAAGTPAEVRAGVISAAESFLDGKHPEDDITFVAILFRDRAIVEAA
jgi:sigma-B regulation protein RsbU (phosphoserine phosphatase)